MENRGRKKYLQLLSLAAVLIWTLFIWHNSLMPGAVSMEKSQEIVTMVEPVLSALQIAQQRMQYWVRKSAHFLEFGLLGILWLWYLRSRMVDLRWSPLYALGLSFLTACADEGIQIFSDRSAQFRDVVIDSAGALTGIVLCMGILLLRKIRKKESGE